MLAGRKSGQQKQLEQAQTDNINQQTQLSKTLADYSQKQYALTAPALSQATGLYSRLVSGNRGEIASAIAPDVGALEESYGGQQKYLEQQGVRGGARDTALADTNRAKAGQIGMLPFLARQNAAGQLANIGTTGAGQSLAGLSSAAGAAGGAAGQAGLGAQQEFNRGQVVGGQVSDFGKSLAGMLIPYLLGQRGGGSVLGSRQTVPNMGFMPGG